jgi:hypothetical protein
MHGFLLGGITWLTACGLMSAGLADDLPAHPAGIGRPASDRGWWDVLARSSEAATAIQRAETCLATPMPPFDASTYLEYSTTGDRSRYQSQHGKRWSRLTHLVIGECLEDKGRFIEAIDGTVKSLCADPSWVLPAHDRGMWVFGGGSPYADLVAACNGYQMALAAWLLDGRLSPKCLALMRENVSRRLTGPVLATIDGTAPEKVKAGHWWASADHNWNAVCTAGAVGAILATEASRETRAKAVEWSVRNMDAFLSGFSKDGYCSEGLGYWNYGFGHFVVLAEVLRVQTGGKVNLYKTPAVRRVAEAPVRLEIADGVCPAFADCELTARPEPRLTELIRWQLDQQPCTGSVTGVLTKAPALYHTLVDLEVRRQSPAGTAGKPLAALPLRSSFSDSGVWVTRPARPGGMAAAWKGGHNAEHHNHNDVGTTVVVWKGRPVIADPGSMVYRAETFSRDRYRLPILSSFGHSVPVVAGTLQAEGKQCRGQVVATDCSDACDTTTIDFSSAYPDTGLKKLERKWIYQRDGNASLVIEDRFSFSKPSAFSTALIGLGTWYRVSGSERSACFLIDGGDGAVLQVDVVFSGTGEWQVHRIDNPGKPVATRLSLGLKAPSEEGFVRMTVRPAIATLATSTLLSVCAAPEKLEDPRKAPLLGPVSAATSGDSTSR